MWPPVKFWTNLYFGKPRREFSSETQAKDGNIYESKQWKKIVARVRKFKTLGAIFSAPDSISSPQNAPDAFSAPIGKLKKRPEKNPPFSPKSASNGGHLFWPPSTRADFDSMQKQNSKIWKCKIY